MQLGADEEEGGKKIAALSLPPALAYCIFVALLEAVACWKQALLRRIRIGMNHERDQKMLRLELFEKMRHLAQAQVNVS